MIFDAGSERSGTEYGAFPSWPVQNRPARLLAQSTQARLLILIYPAAGEFNPAQSPKSNGFLFYPPCPPKGAAVVAGIETVDSYPPRTPTGRMHELSVSGVDADMRNPTGHRVEKDEVSGLHIPTRHSMALMELLFRGVRQ